MNALWALITLNVMIFAYQYRYNTRYILLLLSLNDYLLTFTSGAFLQFTESALFEPLLFFPSQKLHLTW